jgi:hypothetical protein
MLNYLMFLRFQIAAFSNFVNIDSMIGKFCLYISYNTSQLELLVTPKDFRFSQRIVRNIIIAEVCYSF